MFAAILGLDGRPIDVQANAQGIVCGQAADGAAHLAFFCSQPSDASIDVEQGGIASLHGRYGIAGRVRLDARADLKRQLADRPGNPPDLELCLQAYAKWGPDFLNHLAGDFSFVLWDAHERLMLAARDQIGIRPLFHARTANLLIVSDSLDWIADRMGRDLPLDDRWILDFLTANHWRDPDRTVYREIHRLPPGHVLEVKGLDIAVRRYWRLNIVEPLHYRDTRQYGEHFRELLAEAVADRLPRGRLGISMSGGLDSTALAASAVAATGDPARIVAECDYFEELMPDDEKHFASLAARQLGIDLQLRRFDELTYDSQWRTRSYRYPEPSVLAISAHHDRQVLDEMAGRAAVWLYGEGPDNALKLDRQPYFAWLRRRREWGRLLQAIASYTLAKGIDGWRASAVRLFEREDPAPEQSASAWLDRDFVLSVEKERAQDDGSPPSEVHPWHPEAMASIGTPVWQRTFGDLDSDSSAAFTWRHPYFDLRVLEYMLSVPPVPWGWQKKLLRDAMKGRLPHEVLRRRKTPLARSPIEQPIRRNGLPELSAGTTLQQYVAVESLRAASHSFDGDLFALVAAHALDHWLSTRRR